MQRAVAVLQEGIDKNLSIEEERRRRGGPVDKFSDVTDFVANRFRRKGPDTTAPRTGSQSDKDRFKRQIRPRQRRSEGLEGCVYFLGMMTFALSDIVCSDL